MSSPRFKAETSDLIAGLILIFIGAVGALVRANVLAVEKLPSWPAMKQWWPLLLIVVGAIMWIADAKQAH
jgi:uncharacterized protein (DUF983 family)